MFSLVSRSQTDFFLLYSDGKKTAYTFFVQQPTESGDVVDWWRPKQQKLVDW